MTKLIYFDEGNNPRLFPSYCIFLDILGFKREICDAVSKHQEHLLFDKFFKDVAPIFKSATRLHYAIGDQTYSHPWRVKLFTDNVVFGFGLYSGEERRDGLGEEEFGSIINHVLFVQLNCALKGWFLRGGWADGNLFMDEDTVFGSALIEAHDLESKKAVYPRVLLSKRVKNRINIHWSSGGLIKLDRGISYNL